MTAILAIILRS